MVKAEEGWRKGKGGASLFARTAITLALAFILFQALAFWVVYRTLIVPVAERSADDLAGLIVLSAQTWAELPPNIRPAFERELARQHGLRLQIARDISATVPVDFPFQRQIETALSARLGSATELFGRAAKGFGGEGSVAVWVDLPAGGHILEVGFFPDRYAVQPPLAAVTLVSIGAFLVLLTALLLVRRITVPLAHAARAAGVVGRGGIPDPLPETGPQELAELARRFNQMAREVHDLLENRTTLLGGISHDLRTPMTRMQLNLELLQAKFDPAKLDRLQRDLAEMNSMIGGYLELARSTQPETAQQIDLHAFLATLAEKHGANFAGQELSTQEFSTQAPCQINTSAGALTRVLDNLLQNARRYGGETPPTLILQCSKQQVEISVLDNGAGLSEAELAKVFRPFYRVESSRAKTTGGTGLGLAIVKQLAELNGWRIELRNRPGGGLHARLSLPIQ